MSSEKHFSLPEHQKYFSGIQPPTVPILPHWLLDSAAGLKGPTPRNAACFGSTKGSLYVAGGAVNNEAVSVTESFKVSKNAWTTQAPMPQAVGIPGSAVYKGLLYCIGGANNGDLFNNTVYDYVQIYQP
jgi:hypothetical protein